MIPTLRFAKVEDSQKVEGARIFNQDGELNRVVERSIKKNGDQLSGNFWPARSGNTFSFGGHYSNRKPANQEGEDPLYAYQRKEDPMPEPEITRHLYFDNVSRSPIKNASSSGFLDSFMWGGKGSATEPPATGHPNFFNSLVAESSNSVTNSTFKPPLPQSEDSGEPRPQQQHYHGNTIVPESHSGQMSLSERIELLRRPLH